VRNLPEVKPRTPLLGVNNTDSSLQGATRSTSSLVSEVGGLRLAKKALSRCARRKLKKAKAEASEQELGPFSNPEMQACPSRVKPRPKPL
jgi:hypothetical protein